ncbi:uncharacterized protein LOC135931708 [Gordionus sp. m RMFG-2023]|uniref:uncharacterized protein LOC135931708 n=1 Tax=Gordionus sp. m RMFG-2023 TaxID=3053472 RepID=UPI0031FE089C
MLWYLVLTAFLCARILLTASQKVAGSTNDTLRDMELFLLSQKMDIPDNATSAFGESPPCIVMLDKSQRSIDSSDNNSTCNPETFVGIMTSLMNLYCIIPDFCRPEPFNHQLSPITYPQPIRIQDVLWKWFPVGVNKIYLKFVIRLNGNQSSDSANSDSYIPTRAIQTCISRSQDIIEAKLRCKIVNPIKTYYTYAFWLVPLVAGFLFFSILGAVVLVYHVWNPKFEEKMTSRLIQKDEEISELIDNKSVI